MLLRAAAPGSDLSSLRYDVVLHLDDPGRPADPEPHWLDWPGIDDLPALLTESGPDLIGLRGVPHAGQYRQRKAADLLTGTGTVGDLAAALGAERNAVDPTDLVAVATAHGYQIIVGGRISGEPGLLEVVLRRRQADATTSLTELLAEPVGPADWQASDPSWASRARAAVPLLRNHLRERLASNAVPGRIEVLAQWPLAGTGKLDPAALPVGDEDAATEAETDEQPLVEPRTETEQVVARIWSDVLGADRIGVHDDFFSLGGHSLMGAEVIDQVREHFKIDLPLGQLFETPTVAAVAGFVDREKERPRQDATPIRRINRAEYRRASVSGADRRD
jgi:acyl carrier protein